MGLPSESAVYAASVSVQLTDDSTNSDNSAKTVILNRFAVEALDATEAPPTMILVSKKWKTRDSFGRSLRIPNQH